MTDNCPTCGHAGAVIADLVEGKKVVRLWSRMSPTGCVPAERLAETEAQVEHLTSIRGHIRNFKDGPNALLTCDQANDYWNQIHEALLVAEKQVEVLVEALRNAVGYRDNEIRPGIYTKYDKLLADSGLAAAKERMAQAAPTDSPFDYDPIPLKLVGQVRARFSTSAVLAEDVRAVVEALRGAWRAAHTNCPDDWMLIEECTQYACKQAHAALKRPAIRKLMETEHTHTSACIDNINWPDCLKLMEATDG